MPARKPSPVGSHVPTAAGLLKGALPYAERVGAQALQIFLGNPRGWSLSAGDPAVDAAFAERCAALRMPVFVHAPYLINLGSPQPLTVERSVHSLAHALRRCRSVGARGLVLHAGSAVDPAARDAALAQLTTHLLPLLDELDAGSAADPLRVLIEPTPGGAGALAATIDDLEPFCAALHGHPRLGVCLDTCHAYAAGHDLATAGGVRQVLNRLVKLVGRGRLGLVHANDSRDPLGSRRDRHAPVGVGTIGLDPFRELFVHPATRGIPVVIETPGDEDRHRGDLATLRRLRDTAP